MSVEEDSIRKCCNLTFLVKDLNTNEHIELEIEFYGNIRMSSFIDAFIKDMGLEDITELDLTHLGIKEGRIIDKKDAILLCAVWGSLSFGVGLIFGQHLTKADFELTGSALSEFLPEYIFQLLNPTEEDIEEHRNFLASETTVQKDMLDTNTESKKLLGFQPLPRLLRILCYANFLGIDPVKDLFAKIIAEYIKIFVLIKKTE